MSADNLVPLRPRAEVSRGAERLPPKSRRRYKRDSTVAVGTGPRSAEAGRAARGGSGGITGRDATGRLTRRSPARCTRAPPACGAAFFVCGHHEGRGRPGGAQEDRGGEAALGAPLGPL